MSYRTLPRRLLARGLARWIVYQLWLERGDLWSRGFQERFQPIPPPERGGPSTRPYPHPVLRWTAPGAIRLASIDQSDVALDKLSFGVK